MKDSFGGTFHQQSLHLHFQSILTNPDLDKKDFLTCSVLCLNFDQGLWYFLSSVVQRHRSILC